VHTDFWCGDLKETDYMQDQGVEERIILKWIFKNWDGVMDWIDLFQDRDRCGVL
jgi:hypothetical protein